MDFGMIPYDQVSEKQFELPVIAQPYLTGIKNKNPLFYLGLSTWTYRENEKKNQRTQPLPGTLPFYAKTFNAVELIDTYRDMPSPEKLTKWYASLKGTDFKFCPQFYKGISDAGKIDVYKMGITKLFIERIRLLNDKLGTSLLQVNEDYPLEDHENITRYLKELPKDLELSIEIRNVEFLANTGKFELFVKELNALNKGLVITDTPARRDAVHMQLSNGTAFVRFSCMGDDVLDMFRIEQWKKQLKSWYLQGLEKCYFFLHIHNKNAEADFAEYAKQELIF